MIDSLTPEQEELFEVYRDKWIAIGTSCEPCDFEQAKHYARLAYKAAGLTCPEVFYLVDSPMASCELEAKLTGLTKSEVIGNQVFGSHDAGWLSYYDCIWNVLGVKDCAALEGLIGIAKNCGWWSPYEECVIFQHRHSELHLDKEGRIHNENGPAMLYRDGYCVWGIHGNRVTAQIVMRPETLTVEQIHKEPNQDVRSIMVDRFGWIRYIKESGAELIDNRFNVIENTKEALYKSRLGSRLVVTCTTGRVFSLGVPDNITNCEQAQRWLGRDERGVFNVIGRT